MVPVVDGNVMWRAEAYYNRGKALVDLNTAHLAVDELNMALKLAPSRADTYGPELRRAMDLAPAHSKAQNESRKVNSSNGPTIWYK